MCAKLSNARQFRLPLLYYKTETTLSRLKLKIILLNCIVTLL